MRAEAWIFGSCSIFFLLVTPAYWFITEDPTGTAALVMTTLLARRWGCARGHHPWKMGRRPENRPTAEGSVVAGGCVSCPPFSWWPLWCGLTLAVIVFGMAMSTFWLSMIGAGFGLVALSGWV